MSIEIKNVSKKYGKNEALKDVFLELRENKIYGLLGRNGAGKSTLLKIIANRIPLTSGEVLVNGLNSYENNRAQSFVFLMNDENTYPETMTVKEAMYWTKKFYPEADIQKGERLAKQFSLDLKKRFRSLSTGYRTAAKYILAIMSNAEFTLLDEPVLGLDAGHRELLYKTLIEEYADSQRTFVIATHIIEEVSNVIEQVIVIEKGRVIENDSAENLMSSGYSVSGSEKEVDLFIKDKNVISTEKIGSVKVAYILGKQGNIGNIGDLEIAPLSLQKLFVRLTEGKGE